MSNENIQSEEEKIAQEIITKSVEQSKAEISKEFEAKFKSFEEEKQQLKESVESLKKENKEMRKELEENSFKSQQMLPTIEYKDSFEVVNNATEFELSEKSSKNMESFMFDLIVKSNEKQNKSFDCRIKSDFLNTDSKVNNMIGKSQEQFLYEMRNKSVHNFGAGNTLEPFRYDALTPIQDITLLTNADKILSYVNVENNLPYAIHSDMATRIFEYETLDYSDLRNKFFAKADIIADGLDITEHSSQLIATQNRQFKVEEMQLLWSIDRDIARNPGFNLRFPEFLSQLRNALNTNYKYSLVYRMFGVDTQIDINNKKYRMIKYDSTFPSIVDTLVAKNRSVVINNVSNGVEVPDLFAALATMRLYALSPNNVLFIDREYLFGNEKMNGILDKGPLENYPQFNTFFDWNPNTGSLQFKYIGGGGKIDVVLLDDNTLFATNKNCVGIIGDLKRTYTIKTSNEYEVEQNYIFDQIKLNVQHNIFQTKVAGYYTHDCKYACALMKA